MDKYVIAFKTNVTQKQAEDATVAFDKFLHDKRKRIIAISKDVEIIRIETGNPVRKANRNI